MSNQERKDNLPAIIKTCEPEFTRLARVHGVPDFTFERECMFALQILKDADYLAQVAAGNPESLKQAVTNVAAVGLSLSPVHKLAYLVPRKKKVCLDISYQGYVELAVSRGVVAWVKAVLVHDADEFEYQGVNKEPIHKCNPFATKEERGKCIGGFTVAGTSGGVLLVDFMPIHEIYVIRDRSEGYKAYKEKKTNHSIWVSDEAEMIKKTLIRRAYKSWPKSKSDGHTAMAHAITAGDDANGADLNDEPTKEESEKDKVFREEGIGIIRDMLTALEKEEPAFIGHMSRTTNRKIEQLSDLTTLEINQAVTFLEGLVDQQRARLEKLNVKKEA